MQKNLASRAWAKRAELIGRPEPCGCSESFPGTQYTQAYRELRRYRDYELAAAGWFGALQLGLATVIWRDPLGMASLLGQSTIAQCAFSVLIYLLGFSGVLSVCYGKSRYEQLVRAMRKRFGDAYEWPRLPRSSRRAQPFLWIVAVLALLPAVHVMLLGRALHWPIPVQGLSFLLPFALTFALVSWFDSVGFVEHLKL